MSYIIATYKNGKPFAITACNQVNRFELIPIDSDVALNKVYSHPYRAGAYQILSWIEQNDDALYNEHLEVFDEAKFQR